MTSLDATAFDKSTNGRSLSPSQRGLRALATVFPGWAERIALDRFGRPRRHSQPLPDVISGWSVHRFRVPFPGGALAAWTWGQGPAVLLAHGWNGHAGQMAGFAAPLLEAGYRVVTFDQPAHGLSRGRRANLLSFTQALETVAQHVGLLHGVIAHSLGATAAALAAHRGLDPRGLVLIAPPVELPSHVYGFVQSLGLPREQAEGVLDRARWQLGGSLAALDLRRVARMQTVPALLLHGTQDREVPVGHSTTVAAAWPGATLVRLEGLGHTRLLADPAVISRAVDFLTCTVSTPLSLPHSA